MYTRTMFRLAYLVVLFLMCSSTPKTPRIYNVLISSKKNLAPSHAEPVYEPVLKSTSIGYAFPSVIYHTSFLQSVPTTYEQPSYTQEQIKRNPQQPQVTKTDQQLVESAHVQYFIPEFSPYSFSYSQYLPEKQPYGIEAQPQETDPKRIVANSKKNPEIPDVPPPPLPVKNPL